MLNLKEIPRAQFTFASSAASLAAQLERDGLVVLPNLLSSEQISNMQKAFASRLRRLRWNNFEGYQKTEPYRHMVEDVLMLDQGFVDLALHPLVQEILGRYLGGDYELTEAKGWRSVPTKRDFHGWHGDSWYDKTIARDIHKEVKLAMYLTDVRSGAFNFIKGSHQKHHPRDFRRVEARNLPFDQLLEIKGGAGTAFMFDTSAIHRQASPVLEPRQAVFYAYHDPRVPLQKEDIDYYRYHPLLLNAAFLGDLSREDQRILGFGNKVNFQPAFERRDRPPLSYQAYCVWNDIRIRIRQAREINVARAKFLLRLMRLT